MAHLYDDLKVTRILALLLAVVLLASQGIAAVADEAAFEDMAAADESTEDDSAQDGDDSSMASEEPELSSPPSSYTSGPLSKLFVHGFLTQAFATGSFQEGRFATADGSPAGPTAEELSLGIPEEGTTDYRSVAIQFRYEITPQDIMIVQLSSRALGDSPISDSEDEVELDWAFYERRIRDHTSIKVGRVQIPFGIFNEFRDVGTILPFYRPAFVFYREGSFTTETVDGILLSHTFIPESEWSIEANVYFGEFDLVELDPFSVTALPARCEDCWGSQFWLNTPIFGLRFGLGNQRRNLTEGAEGITRPVGGRDSFDEWLASIDAVFTKWVFRAEYREFDTGPNVFPAFMVEDFSAKFPSYYFQVGFHPTQKFRIYLQSEFSDFQTNTALFTERQKFTAREDVGIALNYLFSPNVVLKAEYHDVSGQDQGFAPVMLTAPPFFQLQPIYKDIDDGNYTIISLSASF